MPWANPPREPGWDPLRSDQSPLISPGPCTSSDVIPGTLVEITQFARGRSQTDRTLHRRLGRGGALADGAADVRAQLGEGFADCLGGGDSVLARHRPLQADLALDHFPTPVEPMRGPAAGDHDLVLRVALAARERELDLELGMVGFV